ncbi:MAG: hypothetical protein FJ087_11610 [Deltaproteobacteria bacterium]|nr:hypothetical protein [Deltaproteobacteria bacterium]
MPGETFRKRLRDLFEAVFLVAFFAILFVYVYRPNWEIDVFWHIRTGDWIVANRALPHTDIFSATDPTRPWTPFQWLYEVLVYEVEARLGFTAIRALHAALFMASFALLYGAFRRLRLGRAGAMLLLVLTLALSEDRLRVRPEAFNFLFGALVLPVLLRTGDAARRAGGWTLAGVALVAMAWANVHAGGALLLPISFGAVMAGRAVARLAAPEDAAARDAFRASILLFAAATFPLLPMPGFLVGAATALTMLEESAILIPEWHPPAAYFMPELAGRLSAHHVLCGAVPYLVLALVTIAIAWGVVRHGWRGFARTRDPALLAVALAYAVLGAKSARFIYLDTAALAALAVAWRADVAAWLVPLPRRVAAIVVGVALVGISWESSVLRQRKGLDKALAKIDVDIEPGAFPERASDAISAMGLKGRIFHLASWGGYLIWRHFPDCTVFADGRGNFSAAEREAMVAAHKPWERHETIERAWESFPFEILVMPPPVFPLLDWDRSRWVLVWRDEVAEVYLRRAPDGEENLRRALAWWQVLGVDSSGGADAFQDELLRVLGVEKLERPDVRQRLDIAAQKAFSGDPGMELEGAFDGAIILFDAGRWIEAERHLRRVLKAVPRHSTAALYLAWSQYLRRETDAARETLRAHFLDPARGSIKDRGPLKWAGERILALLLARVGTQAEPPRDLGPRR